MTRTAAKTQWTHEDEAAFLEMSERRERVVGERTARVDAIVSEITKYAGLGNVPACPGSPDMRPSNEKLRAALIARADEVRDALAPFDSGVRATDEPVAVS